MRNASRSTGIIFRLPNPRHSTPLFLLCFTVVLVLARYRKFRGRRHDKDGKGWTRRLLNAVSAVELYLVVFSCIRCDRKEVLNAESANGHHFALLGLGGVFRWSLCLSCSLWLWFDYDEGVLGSRDFLER